MLNNNVPLLLLSDIEQYMTINVGIYIYAEAEVLDFSGPFEVFSTASRVCQTHRAFNVFLVGESSEMVTARGGYRVIPSYGFSNHPPIHVLVVAGGVHTSELKKSNVIEWISAIANDASVVASVCTGAFLLAQAKILDDLNATTHWEDIGDLRNSYPNITVHEGKRWIDEGKVITSGGISAGIDMSLHLVGRLHNVELAERTARQMEFDWTHMPQSSSGGGEC